MKKGVFRCVGHDTDSPKLLTVSVECDANGKSEIPTEYSSKSGDNFNHRLEWEKLGKRVTCGLPFDWYPRGRVEIKNGKCTVYLNPDINTDGIVDLIKETFGLTISNGLREIKIIRDGSEHYRYDFGQI